MGISSFIEEHRLAWEVLLVIISLIAGFFISTASGWWQETQNDKYTAQEINRDLIDFKQHYGWIPQYGHESIFYGVNNSVHAEVFSANPTQPFITSMSIYPSIEHKLQNFDKRLSENITFYYDNLTKAEFDRQELFNERLPEFAIDGFRDDMIKRLHYCWNQIPIIEKQLHDNYGV